MSNNSNQSSIYQQRLKFLFWVLGILAAVFLVGWGLEISFSKYLMEKYPQLKNQKELNDDIDDYIKEKYPQVIGVPIGVPMGTIVAYYFDGKPPDGWLFCDGKDVPEGKEYNKFRNIYKKTPDLKGMFLRGMGQNDLKEYRYTGDKERKLGTPQKDNTAVPEKPLTTNKTDINPTITLPWKDVALGGKSTDMGFTAKKDGTTNITPKISIPELIVTGGDEETRPNNVSVHFIIKAYN